MLEEQTLPWHCAACLGSSPGAGSSILRWPGDGWEADGRGWPVGNTAPLPSHHCSREPPTAPHTGGARGQPFLMDTKPCPLPVAWPLPLPAWAPLTGWGLAHRQLQPGISLVDVSVSGPTWPGPGSRRAAPLPAPGDAPSSPLAQPSAPSPGPGAGRMLRVGAS